MTAFTFPQPGERTNTTSIPVPEHTLAALYALALVGADHLTAGDDYYVVPQCQDALRVVCALLPGHLPMVAYQISLEMRTELEADHPF